MKARIFSLLLLAVVFLTTARPLFADEGMWTFDNPPLKEWKDKYTFEPSEAWLTNARLASVRLNDGGSGAFVSSDGLVVTNQHVASEQLQKLSTAENDLTAAGFYARTLEEELKCPDLEINVLVSYEDVTSRVQGQVKPGSSEKEASEQRRATMAAIEKESTEKTGLRSEVVTLYSGGEYWLYRFKKYTEVKLVFAAEEQIAFFGGDYDNFTFPRHDLDVAFFRVYENGRPLKTEHYFKWSAAGPKDGEFVLAIGNPGSTSRLLTVDQVQYHRDISNPIQMRIWTARRDALAKFAARNAESARRAGSALRSVENNMKRMTGQQEGLRNPRSMERKIAQEKELRAKVAANPELAKKYGDAWDKLAAATKEQANNANRYSFSTLQSSKLAGMASTLVRYSEEIRKPNEKRYPEFRDSKLESLKFSLFSPAPIYPDLEEALLAGGLEEALKVLGAEDPFIKAALEGKTPAALAREVTSTTKLTDAAVRKALFEGGADAIAKGTDPMIALARRVEPIMRELRAFDEEKVEPVRVASGEKIAAARFAVYGKTVSPDATFSIRISYGKVLGYSEDTTLVPYKTTFFGLYDRAMSFDYKPPYDLPKRYLDGRTKLDLSTPLNFVYTADTIGGNSGSPVINRNGEIVGLNFDSNIQKLPNRYWYVDDSEGSRAVAVHSAAIVEALRKLYDAGKLADEITGR